MCKWGENEPVAVTIPADLSSTRQAKVREIGIDRCLAPIVAALEAAGIHMRGSCCGHGKGSGEILLADGRTLAILAPSLGIPDSPASKTIAGGEPSPTPGHEPAALLREIVYACDSDMCGDRVEEALDAARLFLGITDPHASETIAGGEPSPTPEGPQ